MPYVIHEDCSTCHSCFWECPVHAISFVGNEYAIDPETCISCGKCAKVCPTGRITNGKPPKAPALHGLVELTADAVVLGAGGSGLVAAVRYAQLTGKRVIVLEKAQKVGGSTNLGHAFVTRYTKLHQDAGMPDEREQAIDAICADAQPGYSRALLSKAMYGLDEMFNWLYQFGGVEEEFKLVDRRGLPQMGPFPNMPGLVGPRKRIQNLKSTDESMGPGWAGTFVVEKMMAQTKKLGIQVLTSTRAKRLVVDENGVFQAVVAQDAGGEVVVRAKVCLIATGGFSRNRELVSKIRPTFYEGYPVHSFAVASNTGDAVAMAQEVGAQLDLKTTKIPMFSPTHHPYFLSMVWLCNDPKMLMVNRDGHRFMNEGAPPSGQTGLLEGQPGHIAYAIFDTPTAQKMGDDLVARTAQGDNAEDMKKWREDLEYECTLDQAAQKADTIEELAKLIHVDPAVLVETVNTYNAGCASGQDAMGKPAPFLSPVKEGPFYALFQARFNEGATGGIVNDDNLRMVRQDGTPFQGIYLSGDCCRGVLKWNDERTKFGEMPWAMASGYLAGAEMADYTK
jgi:fumarate reductase flavoprotein subunit